MEIDFIFDSQGSVVMIQPVTPEAHDWVQEHLELEKWQWQGPAFSVDWRYARGLAAGIHASDLKVMLPVEEVK